MSKPDDMVPLFDAIGEIAKERGMKFEDAFPLVMRHMDGSFGKEPALVSPTNPQTGKPEAYITRERLEQLKAQIFGDGTASH